MLTTTPTTQALPSRRFDALDGMRGLAALFVMVYHITEQNGLHYARGAYAAVDLFFVLSGFVIMHSYGNTILQGMSFGQYLKARLIRLAPLYFIGLLVGAVAMGLMISATHSGALSMADVWKATSFGLAGLPYLNSEAWPLGRQLFAGPVFPLNGPSWSLFFELFINICFFFYLLLWRRVRAWHVGVLMLGFLASRLLTDEGNPGWGTANFWGGFPRVAAEFMLGALLYNWYPKLRLSLPAVHVALIALVFVFFLSGSAGKVLFDAVVLAPLAIVAAANLELGDRARGLCQWLGDLSYPVYIIHVPLHRLALASFGLDRLAPLQQLLLLGAVVLIVAAALNRVDARLRRMLKTRLA